MSLSRLKIILFFSLYLYSYTNTSYAGTISDALQRKLSLLRKGETISVIVQCSQRSNLKQYKQGRTSAPEMITSLKNISEQNHAKLKSILINQGYKGEMISFWINNTFVLDVTQSLADTIATLPYVANIFENERVVSEDSSLRNGSSFSPTSFNAGWNIKKIKADSVWQIYGINGNSILIGSMDTGVDTTHPSIAPKWRNGDYGWYDAISGNPYPYDDDGHGTHTTGTLIGGDGPGPDTNDIGVAYGATFISAKMLTSGFASIAQVTGAAQWMLDPDGNSATNDFPQVINNSWFSNTRGSTWFVDAATAWRTAGIIPVFCAANFGPSTSSTRSPGDYANCISVGATNVDDNRYGATSVGPSPVGTSFPSDRRKPDISAPGQDVRSCARGGGFAISSGTSMATPHVTGTIALMLQANPNLTYDEVFYILQKTSVDLGDSAYDYVFGYGRIDALNAVREALKFRFEVIPVGNLITSEAGDSVLISMRLRVFPFSPVQVHLSISDTTEGVLISDHVIEFTPDDWNISKALLVRGLPDVLADGDVTYTLNTETQSTDPLYNDISFRVASITNKNAITVNVQPRWNIVSNPMIVTNDSVHVLFPGAIGPAIAFTSSGYQATTQLTHGSGYWVNFSSGSNISLAGESLLSDTVEVMAGWNIIGSVTYSVVVSSITSIPPGIQTGSFFKYNGGYMASDTILPGKGYWVKVSQAGKLILSSSSMLEPNRIQISPTGELPPARRFEK